MTMPPYEEPDRSRPGRRSTPAGCGPVAWPPRLWPHWSRYLATPRGGPFWQATNLSVYEVNDTGGATQVRG
jgi:hypothetical protein